MKASRGASWIPVLFLAAVLGGCAAPRGAQVEVLSERRVDAFVRRGRRPSAFFISRRDGPEGRPVWIDAHRHRTDFATTVAMVSTGPLAVPLIEARAEASGRPYRVLLDTTAAESWTGIDRARTVGFAAVGPPFYEDEPAHVADPIPGIFAAAPSVYVGLLRVDGVLFFARQTRGPLWPLTRADAAERADAILGVPFLRSFAYVQWDFPRREVVLSSGPAYEPDPEAVLAEVDVASMARGVEFTAYLDGRAQRVLLDTAGPFAVAMPDPPAPLLRQVRIGDLVLRRVRAVPTGEMNLGRPDVTRIGIEALAGYRVTLDNLRRVLVIEEP